jgi:hypothetical protein
MNQKKFIQLIDAYFFSSHIFLIFVTLVFTLMLSSCVIHEISTEPEKNHLKIRGSGIVVSKEIDLPYFNSIAMNTAGLVTVSSGNEQYIEITVDDNVLEYISISVENEVLIIETVDNIALSDYELTVDVVMTDLKLLFTNSAGSIVGLTTFKEDQVSLMINSAGNISLDVEANQLNSMINSAGNLFLSGKVISHNSLLSSAGNLMAFDLQTENTMIMINSAGNANVSVSELLEVTINSVGCVYYKGYPQIIQEINSLGRVISAN